jgi:hypothetical protein
VHGLAHAVDDPVELGGPGGVFDHPAEEGKRVRCGVKEPPRAAGCELLVVERGLIPLGHDIGDALDVDHAFPIEIEDGVAGQGRP